MMRNSIFLGICYVILMVSCKHKSETVQATTPAKNPPATVDVMLAQTAATQYTAEVNGTVLPNEKVELHPETAGKVVQLFWPEGKSVTQGTVLAKLNDADLVAQLQKNKVQTSLAQQTEERLRKLLAINAIGQADYDAALNQLNTLKADADILKAQLDKLIIKAPFSGVLGLRSISVGAYVSPTVAIGTLQQTHQLKIDFEVPDVYNNSIALGKTVQVKNNLNTQVHRATITAIEPLANETTRNLKVRAVLEGTNLLAGSFVRVLLPQSSNQFIMLPTQCIIPEARSKKVIVIKHGKGQFTNVTTGLRTETSVAVTSGLVPGDTVVVTGVLFVRPNQPVKIRKVTTLQTLTAN